jgi:hypothetical protein
LKININFDPIIFDDLQPEEKSSEELMYLVLKQTRGDVGSIKKYSRSEIEKVARILVIDGYIRGTALDDDKCVWSKLTRKGERYLDILEREKKGYLE